MTTDASAVSTANAGRGAGRFDRKLVITAAAAASLFLSVAADPASARTVPGSEQERKPAAMQIAAACDGKQDCTATTGGGANADASRGAGAGATRSGGAAGEAGSRRGCGSGLR
ncbi:MAG: hypothetical protein AB7S71_13300 [Dongiaceae bacterium]